MNILNEGYHPKNESAIIKGFSLTYVGEELIQGKAI